MEKLTDRSIAVLHNRYPRESVFCLGGLRFCVLMRLDRKDKGLRADLEGRRSLRATEAFENLRSALPPLFTGRIGEGPTGKGRNGAGRDGGVRNDDPRLDQQEAQSAALLLAEDIAAGFLKADAAAAPYFNVVSYPDFVETADELIDVLLQGLTCCQAEDGSRVVFATKDALTVHQREAQVLGALGRALAEETLSINVQPIRRTCDGAYVSAEVLVRLIDPELGFIPPDEFIPLAEANNLAPLISDYVLEEACRLWRDGNLEQLGVDYLEVNLSAMDFVRADLADRLLAIMKSCGVDPCHINFEITESASAQIGGDLFASCIERMGEAGSSFSVDDFGSGYASISYLIQVPAQLVKIDRGILWSAMKDDNARLVLSSTLDLIHRIGKTSLCEGVETQEMADLLAELGCQYQQGYLYSRPLKPAEYIDFLKDHQVSEIR